MKRSEMFYQPASGRFPDRICARVPFAIKDAAKSVRLYGFDDVGKFWWWPADRVDAQEIYAALWISRPKLDAWCAERVRPREWGGLVPVPPPSIPEIPMTHARDDRRPWDHQRLGYSLIMSRAATMLWWDMGVGKTAPTLNAGATLGGLVLIVAPKIACPVWAHQLPLHTSLTANEALAVDLSHESGRGAAELAEQAIASAGRRHLTMLVVNHAKAVSGPLEHVLLRYDWSMVVADESQYIKNASTKIAKFMRKIGRRAAKRVCLTGTMVPKDLLDVHGQYAFLDPSIFGESPVPFRARYGVYGGFEGRELVGYRNLGELSQKVFSIAHCVARRDVHDLPPTSDRVIRVDLSREARAIYNRLYSTLVADVAEGRLTASNAATRAVHLQKITSGFLDVEAATEAGLEPRTAVVDTGKRSALTEYLSEIGPDEPVVVFAHFRRDLATIHEVAESLGRSSAEISGARHDVSAVWRPSPGEVLAVQIQAGGVGVDFTASCYACYYSVGHNGGAHQQSLARLDRPGQTRPVEFAFLVAADTVDETIHESLGAKADVASALFELARSGAESRAKEGSAA